MDLNRKKLRAAVYCRIDTSKNLFLQLIRNKSELIMKVSPEWDITDYYVDINDDNRAFNRLLRDSEINKIDLVITIGYTKFSERLSVSTAYCGGARVG